MLTPVEEIWVQEVLEWPYSLNDRGYAVLYVPDHPWASTSGQMYRARYIMNVIGRLTERWMVVHHRDRVKLNDHPDNLEVVTPEKHSWIHGQSRDWGGKVSEALKAKGIRPSRECIDAAIKANTGRVFTEEHRRKLSEAGKLVWKENPRTHSDEVKKRIAEGLKGNQRRKGTKTSEAALANLRAAYKTRKIPKEQISETLKKKWESGQLKLTEEQRQARREWMKRVWAERKAKP
jgi:hypothetical protein